MIFRISINLSPRQFRDTKLVEFISDLLQHSGLKPEALILEITEGVLMSGQREIATSLDRLHSKRIGLAMDDFGTGYSSLSHLRNYPFDVLKIDRSFINDLMVDAADWELVNASVLMAHGMGLEVIAEGVETEDQLKQLQNMKCDLAQGFLFNKPITAEAFTSMLQDSVGVS
ncbi:MAG: EAL domain-containing protein [Candidatus Thiodiazotropha sp. (ex. Lucinisca nassula)]|nr:EAL domain-containing protein [Candidatus Thiodiazotropha sp. (ex. Lucinisca nassula)]